MPKRAYGSRAMAGINSGGPSVRLLAIGLTSCLVLLGCESQEVKKCHAEMKVSQQALLSMDPHELDSVKNTLEEIETTLAACKAAKRPDEVRDVLDAKRQVEAHLTQLEEQADRPKREKLSDAELKELIAKGDPNCPRGQGYEHGPSKKMIRCTGPLIPEMTLAQAQEHFQKRGYKLEQKKEPAVLQAEHGAKRYELTYAEGAQKAASCTEVTAPPGMPWQEMTARLTGVHPKKLERTKPVPTKKGPVPLKVEGSESQFTIKLGQCPEKAAPTGAKAPKAQAEQEEPAGETSQ